VNNCVHTIWVHTSLGASSNISPPVSALDDPSNPVGTHAVQGGSSYTTTIQATPGGSGGVSMKISPTSTINPYNIYQIEYSETPNSAGQMVVW
jgi:hypothetical protein